MTVTSLHVGHSIEILCSQHPPPFPVDAKRFKYGTVNYQSSIETAPTALRFDNGTIECATRQTHTLASISDHNLLARQATRDTDLTKTRRSLLV